MKQVKVISVSDNVIYTGDGEKTAIGNAMFRAGDYVWCSGRAVFGHQTASSAVMCDIGGIPIVSVAGGGGL